MQVIPICINQGINIIYAFEKLVYAETWVETGLHAYME